MYLRPSLYEHLPTYRSRAAALAAEKALALDLRRAAVCGLVQLIILISIRILCLSPLTKIIALYDTGVCCPGQMAVIM